MRNVYRHLEDLRKVGLVNVGKSQLMKGCSSPQSLQAHGKGKRVKREVQQIS